jgi:hypothetical protein
MWFSYANNATGFMRFLKPGFKIRFIRKKCPHGGRKFAAPSSVGASHAEAISEHANDLPIPHPRF